MRYWYTSTGHPKFASYSMPNELPISLRYQSPLVELPLPLYYF
ncbi:hypothetical protein [Paenibacillus endoradicis]|nr:hypothetical protein [Paenibacillus endoradicis]MCR8655815.1 hypothetical protein [Paenibacillus endoradicis]MCR8658141.1 hypothetical protein [Paenibacillus endoradicis]